MGLSDLTFDSRAFAENGGTPILVGLLGENGDEIEGVPLATGMVRFEKSGFVNVNTISFGLMMRTIDVHGFYILAPDRTGIAASKLEAVIHAYIGTTLQFHPFAMRATVACPPIPEIKRQLLLAKENPE